ncbi:MAG TPA: alpha-glucan family phosphorylase [Steroidobacteraceae bacterium]|nr:alpha-glucan family phosphorylase [Steroidobacteraceae bacterium]
MAPGGGDPAEDERALIAELRELALDLRWSWNHATDEVWRELEPDLWDRTHNPWVLLRTVSRERLGRLLADPVIRGRVSELASAARAAASAPAWFQQTHPRSPLESVAYFSMEFMLSEALPIYAGGLGNVAGDQLKAASDLGVPVVGVGLLYQRGYFRQVIDRFGGQQALYPYNDPDQLPLQPLRGANGEWLRIELAFPAGPLWLRAWEAQVGRASLYLLDSNDAANYPVYRGVTGELYGAGEELRLQQEIVLGIGGWRLLTALGLRPEVCHLNEGHAALAILERARTWMAEAGAPFATALAVTRPGNIFTTHTAVPAGFDRFAPALIEEYLGDYARDKLGIAPPQLLALGRSDPRAESEPFNMAYLAVRGSGAVNGVSRLHGEVSRRIFAPLFPRRPAAEVPVGHITNGVHTAGWDSPEADALWTRTCGKERWREALDGAQANIAEVSDADLWRARASGRQALVAYARERLAWQLGATGAREAQVDTATRILDPDALTLGFARRFATYKRPNLLLHDRERLIRILTNPQRPVQLILAGKAHPADAPGQALIREWVEFVRQPLVRPHAIFLSDYDMLLTERLVQGVDVWINTPRRPWEACGTSGMKVLVNGGLNLSELDGWWAEAYTPEVGWALGDAREHGNDPHWDAEEAVRLYELLEQEVIPQFYARDPSGVPPQWVARVRASMAQLTARFSAGRSVREYLERYYESGAERYRARAAHDGAAGARIASWLEALERGWPLLRFGSLHIDTRAGEHRFSVEVQLGVLDPQAVRVELYAESCDGLEAVRCEMVPSGEAAGGSGLVVYTARVPAERPASNFTARIVPAHPEALLPLEGPQVLWQH